MSEQALRVLSEERLPLWQLPGNAYFRFYERLFGKIIEDYRTPAIVEQVRGSWDDELQIKCMHRNSYFTKQNILVYEQQPGIQEHDHKG